MKNKHLTNIFLALLVAFPMACDVDKQPLNELSDDTFWKTEGDLKGATFQLYSSEQAFNYDDLWSDDAYAQNPNSVSDGSRSTPVNDGSYSDSYKFIRQANNVIEKSALLKGVLPDATIDYYLAQVRLFRAYNYFNLFRKYGGVVLITKTLNDKSPELFDPRADRDAVLNLIYEDLDFAIARLKLPSALAAADYGTVTQTAALAFKARVALFEGTRAKFHKYGDPVKHLTLAKEAALNVIQSGQHILNRSYNAQFQYSGDGSKETIWANVFGNGNGIDYTQGLKSGGYGRALEQGGMCPTLALANSYLMKDGLPIELSPSYVKPTAPWEEFSNRDLRMSATFQEKGDTTTSRTTPFYIPDLIFQKTGYYFAKFSTVGDWERQLTYMDWPIIRYAEVLLTYAEANYELDEKVSNEVLNKSINLLRSRAGIPPLTNEFIMANPTLNMRDEIRREWRVEFAQEGQRYWNLIRWKTAEIELPKGILGSYLYPQYTNSSGLATNSSKYLLLQASTLRKFNADRDYLWPIPSQQIAISPALKQNPNWP